ncbi:UNVERIFIED_CONTAM: hypothetical protein HDU68_002296 [Siphonaria sp. JEL0065]|nr:hypothetical protein HDU68_002296 [Siphonaria sp. JEL0065]
MSYTQDQQETLTAFPFLDFVTEIPVGYHLGGVSVLPSSPVDAVAYNSKLETAFHFFSSPPLSTVSSPTLSFEMDSENVTTPILEYFSSPQIQFLPSIIPSQPESHSLLHPINEYSPYVDTSDIFNSQFMHGIDLFNKQHAQQQFEIASPIIESASTFMLPLIQQDQLFTLKTTVPVSESCVKPTVASRKIKKESSPSPSVEAAQQSSNGKKRTQLSKEQREYMQTVFEQNNMPNTKVLQKVSAKVGMELSISKKISNQAKNPIMQGPAIATASFSWPNDVVYDIPAGYTLGGCDVVPSIPLLDVKEEATPVYDAFLPSPPTDYRFEYDLLDASTRGSLPAALTPELPILSPMAMHPLLQTQTVPWIDTSAFYVHSNICIPSSTTAAASPPLKVIPNSLMKPSETKKRIQLTCEQRDYLLRVFEKDNMPKSKALQKVALDCKMDYRQVQYWFQNRRAAMRRRMAAAES